MIEDKASKKIDFDTFIEKETSFDIDEILDRPRDEYHYDNGRMTRVESDFVSVSEISKNTTSYNKSHKSEYSEGDKERIKKFSKKSHSRALQTILLVLCILVAGVALAVSLYPQAQLSELSRDNSDLKDDISDLKKAILDAKGESEGITDMDSIRAQAMALGMQDPNVNQIVTVPMTGSDRLITVATYNSDGISDDALETAEENLKEYYHRVNAS